MFWDWAVFFRDLPILFEDQWGSLSPALLSCRRRRRSVEWPSNYNSPQKLKTERCWTFGGGVEANTSCGKNRVQALSGALSVFVFLEEIREMLVVL